MSKSAEFSYDEDSISEFDSDSSLSDIRVLSNGKMRIISDTSENSDDDIGNDAVTVDNDLDNDIFLAVPSNTQFSHEPPIFFETPGPKHRIPSNSELIDYFNLFFTATFLSTIVLETNRYAANFLNSQVNLKPKSRVRAWKPITLLELKAFIAVILEMGITRRPSIYSYWEQNSRCIPWFRKMFARDRFQLILKFFHVVDNSTLVPPGQPNYDPCARFSYVVDHANKIFRLYYVPHQQLSIYESLVGTYCHTKIKYMPNKKHHKRGIKFWMLCDAVSNYCLSFFCYKGVSDGDDIVNVRKFGLGYTVVEKFMKVGNYLDKGYHLFTDNFFTSVSLAKALRLQTTYFTGTIRKNKREIPAEAKHTNVGESKYFKTKDILMCAHRDKKKQKQPVILISTNSSTDNITITKKKGLHESVKEKPKMIHNYNKYMGGADESDKMLYVYLDERRTLKYWKKVVFNIFGRMVLNSYILYSHDKTKPLSRLEFTSKIIENIENEWLSKKCSETPSSSRPRFNLERLPGTKLRKCVVCSMTGATNPKCSRLICNICKKGVHGTCIGKHKCV